MYTVFMARNESFSGQISVMGHSLGSIILFDVLSHQNPDDSLGVISYHSSSDKPASIPTTQAHNVDSPPPSSLSELFARLDIDQRHAEAFTKEGIDLDAVMTCQETDLMEVGMEEKEREALLGYINSTATGSGEGGGGSPVRKSEFGFVMGRAGTGQPSVRYPRLCFQPASFYALGSPIGMFQVCHSLFIILFLYTDVHL